MYWYYKIPLLALAFLAVFGLGYLVWTHLPGRSLAPVSPLTAPAGTVPAPAVSAAPAPSVPVPGAGARKGTPRASVPLPPSAVDEDAARRVAAAAEQLRQDNLGAARILARKVLADPSLTAYGPTWIRAAEVVSRVASVLVNSDAPAPEKRAYVVQSGDSLVKIAYQQHTTVGALQRLNNLNPTSPMIYPGNVLYVLDCDWSIVVIKSRFLLLLMDGQVLFKYYVVGIGRQNRTPVGTFEIKQKVFHPAWTPFGKQIPYGHPENVLGTHWLGVKAIGSTDPTLMGYGIHGTWEPETVGTAASQGCVRMRNEDVDELFDLVPLGVKVEIRDE